jgi:Sulfotransferase family
MDEAARPIFIVGSPRSGTSVLTWSLGQHPNILPLEETTWLAQLAAALGPIYASGTARGDRSQLSVAGVPQADFFRWFGNAADRLIRRYEKQRSQDDAEELKLWHSPSDPKERWVDGAPENSFYIQELLKLFPGGQFIHVLRDVQSVVKSLMNFARLGVPNYSEQSALDEWIRKVTVCVQAEHDFGPARFLRILHRDLVDAPEATVARCLDFLQEPFCPDCLKPLRMKINSSNVPPDFDSYESATDPELREEAARLSAELLAGSGPQPGELVSRMQKIVQAALPPTATLLVISKGDDRLLELGGRKAWHFPQNEHGLYAGYYPADSTEAIGHLETLRARGGQFLLLPSTAFWWLDHYADFRQHLDYRYRRIWDDADCLIYELFRPPPDPEGS